MSQLSFCLRQAGEYQLLLFPKSFQLSLLLLVQDSSELIKTRLYPLSLSLDLELQECTEGAGE